MTDFNLGSKFTFGKHNGKTLLSVVNTEPSYIDWCAQNIDSFVISAETVEEIKKIKPNFSFSPEAQLHLDQKCNQIETYPMWCNEFNLRKLEKEFPKNRIGLFISKNKDINSNNIVILFDTKRQEEFTSRCLDSQYNNLEKNDDITYLCIAEPYVLDNKIKYYYRLIGDSTTFKVKFQH